MQVWLQIHPGLVQQPQEEVVRPPSHFQIEHEKKRNDSMQAMVIVVVVGFLLLGPILTDGRVGFAFVQLSCPIRGECFWVFSPQQISGSVD